jgi:hypothetical protein
MGNKTVMTDLCLYLLILLISHYEFNFGNNYFCHVG